MKRRVVRLSQSLLPLGSLVFCVTLMAAPIPRDQDENEDAPLKTIAQQIAQDEQEHVQILRTALGDSVIARPKIDLAALGVITKRSPFLALARAFEDVGVSAYGGAAPLIQSKTILGRAAPHRL